MATQHYRKVKEFMVRANQEIYDSPTVPSGKTRLLRAKLIFEEAIETIEALGFTLRDKDSYRLIGYDYLEFVQEFEPNLVEVADGCADIAVVTTGTLISCGIDNEPLQDVIDESNLAKFKEGHRIREDGKLIKPPDWKAPDIQFILDMQTRCNEILHELRGEKRPISQQRVWERLGSPMERNLKVFESALAYLVATGQINVSQGMSNSDRLFYV